MKFFRPKATITKVQQISLKGLVNDTGIDQDFISTHIFELGLISLHLIKAPEERKKEFYTAFNKMKNEPAFKELSKFLNIYYHWGDLNAGSDYNKNEWEKEYMSKK